MTPLESLARSRVLLLEKPMELWGGVECTINRVGESYFNQMAKSGHLHRLDDLDRISALGIRTLRFPILWEEVAPDSPAKFAWNRIDAGMARLRELGIKPIIGLLHHGSGPRYTELLDPAFPVLLAHFARHVAQRFPDVQDWTPVNEPLTTARFSGLYGHWYPHGHDRRTFARALLNETQGIVAAMEAIRKVIPKARLVQTEDLGEVQSTRGLEYQAEFENERRWLSFDLLTGKLHRESPVADYLSEAGIAADELRSFEDNPCPPDLLGLNHYVTSSRYLDGHLERYPVSQWGSNGSESYVDCAAVRAAPAGMPPLERLLGAAWERYQLPLAVTESHLGCTREEQMRWLLETWEAAQRARAGGIPVSAVTAWALFGSSDWDSLLTQSAGHYEPGVFDVRSEFPRPTALARLVRELASPRLPTSTLAQQPGWWNRPVRYLPQVARLGTPSSFIPSSAAGSPILVSGENTTVGRVVARMGTLRGLHFKMVPSAKVSSDYEQTLRAAFAAAQPWALINAGGGLSAEQAMAEPARCFDDNARRIEIMARVCAEFDVALLTFSSGLVFDGSKEKPYVESDLTSPVNILGHSQAVGEAYLRQLHPRSLIVRTGALFGPWDDSDFVSRTLACLQCGLLLRLANDLFISPTYLPQMVHAALDLLIDGEQGLWHLANSGQASWYELACAAAAAAGADSSLISGCSHRELPLSVHYPRNSTLQSERAQLLPPWREALGAFWHERQLNREAAPQRAEMALMP